MNARNIILITCVVCALQGCAATSRPPVAANAVTLSTARTSVVRVIISVNPESPGSDASRRQGSGVIIDNHCVLTCAHLLEGVCNTDEVWVEMDSPKMAMKAKLVGSDADSDVALLQCELPFDKAFQIQLSDRVLSPGETVYAVGFPMGLEKVITSGIVSAKGWSGIGILPVEDFVVTDAAVGLGSSGGALIDSDGRMVGLVSAVLTQEGSGRPLGLAVSSPLVCNVVRQLKSGEPVHRGYLGARVGYEITPLDLSDGVSARVEIEDVIPGSPADRAGLSPGDVVVMAGNHIVESVDHLRTSCRSACPGDKLIITVYRNGKNLPLTVVLGDMFEPENAACICDFCPYCGCSTF